MSTVNDEAGGSRPHAGVPASSVRDLLICDTGLSQQRVTMHISNEVRSQGINCIWTVTAKTWREGE